MDPSSSQNVQLSASMDPETMQAMRSELCKRNREFIANQLKLVTAALFDTEVVNNTANNRSRLSVTEILSYQENGQSLDAVF
eukprot:CAMPEP_0184703934 /NCGR_PEP_ID=MMETSP0313-20130426/29560_1 /TAXON_ID=2792 /ORGANISM="Porphyridium aerugineum, Strain SAG 1380-2" /LENGTH=81 /DNA_ID=CAMNT_0027164851 /DNA_START=63 /DNA_END=305 /DNA_ORIENTATION=-